MVLRIALPSILLMGSLVGCNSDSVPSERGEGKEPNDESTTGYEVKVASEVLYSDPIEIELQARWQVSAGYNEELNGKSLSIDVYLWEENNSNSVNDGYPYVAIEIDREEQLLLSIDGASYDLYHHNTNANAPDDSSLTIPGNPVPYYRVELLNPSADEKFVEMTFIINAVERYISVTLPEHLQVSYDDRLVNSYNSFSDDLNIEWTSGMPIHMVRLIPTWAKSPQCPDDQLYDFEHPTYAEIGSYTILAGSVGECVSSENMLELKSGGTELNIESENFSLAEVFWYQSAHVYFNMGS